MGRRIGKSLLVPIVVAIALLAGSVASAADESADVLRKMTAADESAVFIHLPPDGAVVFRGSLSLDDAGLGSGAFLYPAPGLAGLLAAIATHGVIVESAKQSQKDKLQASADQVLTPYLPHLDGFTYDVLMRRAVARMRTASRASVIRQSEPPGSGLVVESMPVISMTQDQRAIIVDNLIVVRKPNDAGEIAYQGTIRVISRDWEPTDPVQFWTAEGGERLKTESAGLVAESLDIALSQASQVGEPQDQPQKTVRYRTGGSDKFERAQILQEHCGRLLIRTLRGALMSVPSAPSKTAAAATAYCGSDAKTQN